MPAEFTSDLNSLTQFVVSIEVPFGLLNQVSLVEFSLTESLMTPSLTTKILIQNARHIGYVKNLDMYANAIVNIQMYRPLWGDYLNVQQVLFKISQRDPVNYQYDQMYLNCVDNTLLRNAATRVSKSYKCTTPSAIVNDMLGLVGAGNRVVEGSSPVRTYFAENVHPFQVIANQADQALAIGSDPSFFHYMTYENYGTHRFESLRNMARQSPIAEFVYNEKTVTDKTYSDPKEIMAYNFPCDFDLLSDILNAVDVDGVDQKSLTVINPFNGIQSILGNQTQTSGMGGLVADASFTNKGSASAEGNCEIDVEKYRLRRQARLGLLEQDRIPLRLTIPFNPNMFSGKTIDVKFNNKIITPETVNTVPDYGSGTYLITAVTHTVKVGGFATTVMDCVSRSVGFGGQTLGQ